MHPATPHPPGTPRTLRAVAIIPARLGSRRLERKMLLRETGQYLFEHTARNLIESGVFERVVVATDSEEIEAAAAEVGLEAISTRSDHQSGTDRIFEALGRLEEEGAGPFDVVLNVQGDEPDVAADDLRALVGLFADPQIEMATLWAEFAEPEDALAPSAVKVVVSAEGDALYFSRAAIPSIGHARSGALEAAGPGLFKLHVGVYAFRPAALARFCSLPHGVLEGLESLEQLRWLEAGGRLRVLPATHRPSGIDTAEDYSAFVARLAAGSTSASDPSSPGAG